jgi:hypothetical protein
MLEKINQRMIDKKFGKNKIDLERVFWNADAFHLQNVDAFQKLPPDIRHQVLKNLSQEVIEESTFIEQVAIDFSSWMTLNSINLQQREAYSLMNSDEISHYFMLKQFLNKPLSNPEDNRFMQILLGVMATKSKPIMIFFGQVLLEGLSAHFYKNLLSKTNYLPLQQVTQQIYLDEAAHHSIGLSSLKLDSRISTQDSEQLFYFIECYLLLQQSLFARIIESLSSTLGCTKIADQNEIYQQMNAEIELQQSFNRIRSLLDHSLTSNFIDKLDAAKLLTAPREYARP